MHGRIIIIEGLDGCGKSTQLELLRKRFTGCRFLTFPNYQSSAGEIVTEYLNGRIPDPDPFHSAYSASTFYAADRYISYRKDWYVDYTAGKHILSARYTTSNAIYQMTKLPPEEWDNYCSWLYDYEYTKLGIPAPDHVIFLDVPVEVSQRLLNERYAGGTGEKDIHEADPDYLRRCYTAAQYAAKHDPFAEWHRIDCCEYGALRSPESIQNELSAKIAELLR